MYIAVKHYVIATTSKLKQPSYLTFKSALADILAVKNTKRCNFQSVCPMAMQSILLYSLFNRDQNDI